MKPALCELLETDILDTMNFMKRLLRKELLFSLAILIAGLLLLEVAARWLVNRNTPEPAVPPSIGQYDRQLGWSLKPLAYDISRRTGQLVEYQINSKGLRSPETTYEKPAGILRIVLLGDSRTFGFGVPIEKHFSTLLGGYFDNVEVINMGVGGFGVDQELLFLEQEGFRYQPDIVIAYVAHYSNERHMHTERFGKQKPRFVLEDGKLVLTGSPVPAPETAAAPTSLLKALHRWLAARSIAYRTIMTGVLAAIRGQSSGAATSTQDELSETDASFRQEMYDLGAAIVFEMNDASARQGARFVLVTQVPELYAAATGRQILTLDAIPVLANHRFDLPDDLGHINEAGNGALAWEIARFLAANQLVPGRDMSQWTTQKP